MEESKYFTPWWIWGLITIWTSTFIVLIYLIARAWLT